MTDEQDVVRCAVTVPLSPDQTFALFTDRLGSWWPRIYTWSKDALDLIAIEPHEGGRCFEQANDGFVCDWGKVLVYDPPHRLTFAWRISPSREPEADPAKGSTVDVTFERNGASATRVELVHRDFFRHGDEGDQYRASMSSAHGWPLILDRFADAGRA